MISTSWGTFLDMTDQNSMRSHVKSGLRSGYHFLNFKINSKLNRKHSHQLVICQTDKKTQIGMINAFHAAGKCRRPVKNVTKFKENDNMLEFHDLTIII